MDPKIGVVDCHGAVIAFVVGTQPALEDDLVWQWQW
jgi:hypothetical protein